MTLKDYIQTYCETHDIKMTELAKHADMPRSSLYNLMDEKKSATLINLAKLSHAMQVHPQYLVQLEWQKYKLAGTLPTPVNPLTEPDTWFDSVVDSSNFIAETIADGKLIRTGETFVKTWRLQNTGSTDWIDRYLVCQNHDKSIQQQPSLQGFSDERCFFMTPTIETVALPKTLIGETVDISVEFTAPDVPAVAFSYWKMTDSEGQLCFPDSIGLYVQVSVVSAGSAFTTEV